MTDQPAHNLPEHFLAQARQCGSMDSPFMQRLLSLIAEKLRPGDPVMDKVLNWPGDPNPNADSVPLRLAGGLHALVLEGLDSALAQCYPPEDVSDAKLWDAVDGAMRRNKAFFLKWLDSPPQTNEVRRSVALIPAAHLVMERLTHPLILSELGASGGLNLNFHRFGLEIEGQQFGGADPVLMLTPDWDGPHPPATEIKVSAARGIDLNPLTSDEDAKRLRAYLWADQPQRMALTNAALTAGPRMVDAGDVAPWLEARLAAPFPGQTHFIFHTVAWQYFPEDIKAQCRNTIENAGQAAAPDSPLAWFGMEADGALGQGAALTLRLWPGDITIRLGRADFHGRWIKWNPQEV